MSRAPGARVNVPAGTIGPETTDAVRFGVGIHPGGRYIAASIATGIGFLGAGAIFKEGMTISGLTTATSIWVTAALGMAVGAGQLALAVLGLVLALFVLIVFEWLHP